MILVVVVSFFNEERYLGTLLESVSKQTRLPDRLILVDDGSTDDSARIATDFAARHPFASVLQGPAKPVSPQRFPTSAEWRTFLWAMEQIDGPFDLAAKLDADLLLTPDVFAEMEARFDADPGLGLAGPAISEVDPDGKLERLRGRAEHIHGATKFYRRKCYEDILPLPPIVGWDMVDEVKARSRGWRTATFSMGDGDPVHLRPTGRHGNVRRFRRWGQGDYANGAHPLLILLVACHRLRFRPWVLGSLSYLAGWSIAAVRRMPRFESDVRAFALQEQRARMRRRLWNLVHPSRHSR